MSTISLTAALERLRDALACANFPLELPDAKPADTLSAQLVNQLTDYVLPRLENHEAPLLAVVGGSTGVGKSTLVNTLLGRQVSKPGVIRPTTKTPVLVYHPEDESWFKSERFLSGLKPDQNQENQGQENPSQNKQNQDKQSRAMRFVADPGLPVGLGLLDAPDIDSIDEENRILASALLDVADLWLFVTSAARYADAIPWEFLQEAAERGISVAMVLDRLPSGAINIIPADLGRMMTERGLGDAPLFVIPETIPDNEGLLPDATVSQLRTYLATLAADKERRSKVIIKTLDGTIESITAKAPKVADAVDSQLAAITGLNEGAENCYVQAIRAVAAKATDGSLLKGEVLSSWRDYVETSDLMWQFARSSGQANGRITDIFSDHPAGSQEVMAAADAGLADLIQSESEAAAERVTETWAATPAGRQLLKQHPKPGCPTEEISQTISATIQNWQSDIYGLIVAESRPKQSGQQPGDEQLTGACAALVVAVFTSANDSASATNDESDLARRVLVAVFGEETVRKLIEAAKQSLDNEVSALFSGELSRYLELSGQIDISKEMATDIRTAIYLVKQAKTADEPQAPRYSAANSAAENSAAEKSAAENSATEESTPEESTPEESASENSATATGGQNDSDGQIASEVGNEE